MNFKKEKVLILQHRSNDIEDRRIYINARTTEYKGHKFNIQGDYNSGYIISDNVTGCLISQYFYTLKSAKEEFQRIADSFLENICNKKDYYERIVYRFNKAKIVEEE